MEILNNIWMALSTPNNIAMNIIYIIGGLIENFLTMQLFLTIFNINSTKKQKLLFVFFITFVSIITMYIIPNPYNAFVNYIINILLLIFIFKLSFFKSILATICPVIIFGLVGTFLSTLYFAILHITSEQVASIPIYRIGYLLLMYIFMSLIILLIHYRQISLNKLEELDTRTRISMLANIILGFLTLITQCIIVFFYIDILPLWITSLSFVSLLAYISISIYSLTRVIKLTLTTKRLENSESYNNTLRILHDNVRGFKHDFDNIVTTIGGYIRTEDMEGLKKYYLELEDDCQRVNNLYILNPEVVNNDGIYNLLTKKYNEADSKDIKVNITFLLDLGELHMKVYEFARILGILLDNAIEASSECEEKIINLSFRNDTKNSRELITVENTYNNKDIDTEKIFEKGISEKENHTGLGLWEVRKIIKKNNNINLHTSKTDKFFIQTLEIYY